MKATLKDELPDLDEEGYIPGIFDYCDRRCERCKYCMYCKVYDSLSDENGNLAAPDDNDFPEQIKTDMKFIRTQVDTWMEENEINLDSREIRKAIQEEKKIISELDKHPLFTMAVGYASMYTEWRRFVWPELEARYLELSTLVEAQIKPKESADHLWVLAESIQQLDWHCFQISVKIRRALNGKMSDVAADHQILKGEFQSDPNGSAKVAIVGVNESYAALHQITDIAPDIHVDTIHILDQLLQLREGIENEFPHVWKFKRIGFDD